MSGLLRMAGLFVAAMVAQWWWSTHGSVAGVAPQLLLVLTVVVAAKHGPLRGMVLGFLWGLFLDVLAARLVGANALGLTLVAYGTGSVRRQVDLLGLVPQTLMVFWTTLVYFAFIGVVGLVFNRTFLWVGWASLLILPFYNGAVTLLAYGVLESMEAKR